jgi:hypothetical protein
MKKLILLFSFISNIIFAQTGKEKILVTDMTKIQQVNNVSIAPDGKRAIYALMRQLSKLLVVQKVSLEQLGVLIVSKLRLREM